MLIRQNWAREGLRVLTSIDLFCGAGGLTEGFREGGFHCLYGNDFNSSAIETFELNHPAAWTDFRPIEQVEPKTVRRKLGLKKSELSVLNGGPPCQGFSINAPERFLEDPRNILFKHYLRFLDEFEPQTLVFENVPGMPVAGRRPYLRACPERIGEARVSPFGKDTLCRALRSSPRAMAANHPRLTGRPGSCASRTDTLRGRSF